MSRAREINDEFTHLPVSRQWKFQLRRIRDAKCVVCGEPAKKGKKRCAKHLAADLKRSLERAKARRMVVLD